MCEVEKSQECQNEVATYTLEMISELQCLKDKNTNLNTK